ncbi:hypothetical protein MSG28_002198 [Choristoneura fumiferana]|uniref:Uncharacterized protein n=1 Tax=Choristoneura fumiferana TaxID=7141 RepID=A0ACC0JUS4_CHOFU|nr:hypothetical protein MSG28_002198 [Choristoneura fumiferana]
MILVELGSSLFFPLAPVSEESDVGSDVSIGEESSLPANSEIKGLVTYCFWYSHKPYKYFIKALAKNVPEDLILHGMNRSVAARARAIRILGVSVSNYLHNDIDDVFTMYDRAIFF